MIAKPTTDSTRLDHLTTMIARRLVTDRARILPFADVVDLLSDLFTAFGRPTSRLIAVGHVTPEVAQAADRARADLEELLPPSPFAGDPTMVTQAVTSPHDIIYLANPNRITGATYSLSEMESMARVVPHGALIVDEHYFEYFGVTAAPLTELRSNTVCLRSFTAPFSINSADAGFVMGGPTAVEKIAQAHRGYVFTRALCRTVETVLANDQAMARRLCELHDETLRIAEAIDACGIQGRLSPTDFILLRVADPKEFGNALARDKVAIENLDGYPQMKNYVRYRVESPLNNDRFIRSIQGMKPECCRMKTRDDRPTIVRHAPEWSRPMSLRRWSRLVDRSDLATEEEVRRSELVMESPATD